MYITYWTPWLSSTQGHRSILNYVRSSINKLRSESPDETIVMTHTSSASLEHESQVWQLNTPRILLVDWPWAYHIDRIPSRLLNRISAVVCIQMSSSQETFLHEKKAIDAGKVHALLCVEPTRHAGADYAIEVAPLVNPDAIQPLSVEESRWWHSHVKKRGNSVLAMQSGWITERNEAVIHAERLSRRYPVVVPSSTIPYPYAGRFSRLATATVAAPGYSTFWEFATMRDWHSEPLVAWQVLRKPAEDFETRIGNNRTFDQITDRYAQPDLATALRALIDEFIRGNRHDTIPSPPPSESEPLDSSSLPLEDHPVLVPEPPALLAPGVVVAGGRDPRLAKQEPKPKEHSQ